MKVVIGAKQVVDGLDTGLRKLTLGAVARVHCPSHYGYGGGGGGRAVPPDADLVFEVQVVKLRQKRSRSKLTPRELRALFLVRPPSQPLSYEECLARGAAALRAAAPSVRQGAFDMVPTGQGLESGSTKGSGRVAGDLATSAIEAESDDDNTAAAQRAAEGFDDWEWVRRLRPAASLPIEETRTFFDLVDRMGAEAYEQALAGDTATGTALLPEALPIKRIPHGAGPTRQIG